MADTPSERDPLERLAADYMERLRQGEHPSMEEYAAQHPELAEEIRDLFPTIAVTERLKTRQARSSDGRATLGPARLERLGDFRLIREIGRGGMGIVFEAEQESLGRRVAVKVLPRQMLLEEKHRKRFQREARVAAGLHHTNIVEVFGVGEQDGFNYYVMQYIRGVGLDAVIPRLAKLARGGKATEPAAVPPPGKGSENVELEAAVRHLLGTDGGNHPEGGLGPHYCRSVARIGLQGADALNYAHSQGTLHRDIKPANLLLDAQGTVWVVDFGLAKTAQSEAISVSNDIVGTLRFMAPERFRGVTDHRSDLYSLGLALYELLTLRSAYEETDHSRLIERITQGPPLAPGNMLPGTPPDLETIILKAISYEVSQRYQSAEALAGDLRRFLEDRPVLARRAGPAERLARWCRRNKSLASLAGTTLFLLVLVTLVSSLGYIRTRNALQGESSERAKAEGNAALAIEALDRIFERYSPARLGALPQVSVEGVKGQTIPVPVSPVLSKEAAALLEEMLPFYDRLARQTGNDDRLRARTADANRRVGAIRQRLGQWDEALAAYYRAIDLYQELAATSRAHPHLELEVARIDNEIGRTFTAQRQEAKARESHLAALALLQTEAAPPSAPAAFRFELARTHYFLGIRERPLPATAPHDEAGPARIPDEQRDSLATAVTLLKELIASPPANPEYQQLLALCYLEGARAEDARQSAAKGGADRAIEILEALTKAFPGIPDYAYDLSEAYARIHIPHPSIAPDAQKTIEERLGRSSALLEQLVLKHPEVPDYLAAQARICDKLGALHRQMEQWADAEQSFRQAVSIQALLVNQFPEAPNYGLWMATFRIAHADALIRLNQPAQARAELEATISALLLELKQRPEIHSLHDLLALGYSKLEIVLRQTGENTLATEAARKASRERNPARDKP